MFFSFSGADIAHIYSKFLGPLPPSIEEFAASIHKNLPFVVDTKNLLKDNIVQHLMKNNSTSLSSAFALLCPQIAYTSKRSDVLSRSCMKVEVQVDETRSALYSIPCLFCSHSNECSFHNDYGCLALDKCFD